MRKIITIVSLSFLGTYVYFFKIANFTDISKINQMEVGVLFDKLEELKTGKPTIALSESDREQTALSKIENRIDRLEDNMSRLLQSEIKSEQFKWNVIFGGIILWILKTVLEQPVKDLGAWLFKSFYKIRKE